MIVKKLIPIIALLTALFNGLFWSYFPKGSYYVGNALFITLLAFIIYSDIKPTNFIKFIIFEFALFALIDEIFFDATKTTLIKALTLVIIPFVWLLKNKYLCSNIGEKSD